MKPQRLLAFTLVELLVVIAIIAILMAAMIPAILSSRNVARMNECQQRASRLILAVSEFYQAHEVFPPGTTGAAGPIRSEAVGDHRSWLILLLPYADEQPAARSIVADKSVYDPANAHVRGTPISAYRCPSEADENALAASYAGCHHDAEAPIDADNHGVFFLDSRLRQSDIPDGLSHTLFFAEKLAERGDLGWMSGTRATLRNTGRPPNDDLFLPPPPLPTKLDEFGDPLPNQPPPPPPPVIPPTAVGGFGSLHTNGLHAAFGSGQVRFIHDQIDGKVWQQLGHRNDSGPLRSPSEL